MPRKYRIRLPEHVKEFLQLQPSKRGMPRHAKLRAEAWAAFSPWVEEVVSKELEKPEARTTYSKEDLLGKLREEFDALLKKPPMPSRTPIRSLTERLRLSAMQFVGRKYPDQNLRKDRWKRDERGIVPQIVHRMYEIPLDKRLLHWPPSSSKKREAQIVRMAVEELLKRHEKVLSDRIERFGRERPDLARTMPTVLMEAVARRAAVESFLRAKNAYKGRAVMGLHISRKLESFAKLVFPAMRESTASGLRVRSAAATLDWPHIKGKPTVPRVEGLDRQKVNYFLERMAGITPRMREIMSPIFNFPALPTKKRSFGLPTRKGFETLYEDRKSGLGPAAKRILQKPMLTMEKTGTPKDYYSSPRPADVARSMNANTSNVTNWIKRAFVRMRDVAEGKRRLKQKQGSSRKYPPHVDTFFTMKRRPADHPAVQFLMDRWTPRVNRVIEEFKNSNPEGVEEVGIEKIREAAFKEARNTLFRCNSHDSAKTALPKYVRTAIRRTIEKARRSGPE